MSDDKTQDDFTAPELPPIQDSFGGGIPSDATDASSFYDDITVDGDEAAKVQRANMYAGGTYMTDSDQFGPFVDTPKVAEDGRRSVFLFGRGRVKTKGVPVENALGYSISPDARPKKDAMGEIVPGKNDLATRLYADAVMAYQKTHGESPKNLRAVVEYLAYAPLALRCMPGSDRPVVLGIQAARGGR